MTLLKGLFSIFLGAATATGFGSLVTVVYLSKGLLAIFLGAAVFTIVFCFVRVSLDSSGLTSPPG